MPRLNASRSELIRSNRILCQYVGTDDSPLQMPRRDGTRTDMAGLDRLIHDRFPRYAQLGQVPAADRPCADMFTANALGSQNVSPDGTRCKFAACHARAGQLLSCHRGRLQLGGSDRAVCDMLFRNGPDGNLIAHDGRLLQMSGFDAVLRQMIAVDRALPDMFPGDRIKRDLSCLHS